MRPQLALTRPPTQAAGEALERARSAYNSDWSRVRRHAIEARMLAVIAGDLLTQGRALHLIAEATVHLGGGDPGPLFEQSVNLLERCGGGIYLACALNDQASYFVSLGRGAEAEALRDSAFRLAVEAGDENRGLIFEASRAFDVYGEGRYDDALERTEELAGRFGGNDNGGGGEGLCHILRIRTLALLALGRAVEALRAAEGYEVVCHVGSDWDRVAAPLLVARAAVAVGDFSAVERFPILIGRADRLHGKWPGKVARLWCWASLLIADPVQACRRFLELYRPILTETYPVAQMERRAVDRLIRLTSIDVSDLNRFPSLESARARLYLAAYAHTRGNATHMARLLGRDRVSVSLMMRELGLRE